jgi:hypothetical protein
MDQRWDFMISHLDGEPHGFASRIDQVSILQKNVRPVCLRHPVIKAITSRKVDGVT